MQNSYTFNFKARAAYTYCVSKLQQQVFTVCNKRFNIQNFYILPKTFIIWVA